MSRRFVIADAILVERTVKVIAHPAVYASKCDSCGRVFDMKPFCNDTRLGELDGTFDKSADDPETGRGLGNIFSAMVCSFACADAIFGKRGWVDMEEYRPFVDAGAELVRAELKLTSYVIGRAELLAGRK